MMMMMMTVPYARSPSWQNYETRHDGNV